MLRSLNDVIIVNTLLFAYILYVTRDGILFNVFKVSFLEFITVGVRGAIPEQSMNKLNTINIPRSTIKSLMNTYTKMPSNASLIYNPQQTKN